jgi:hypothetical protein
MQTKIFLAQIQPAKSHVEDFVDIDEALNSENHLKILAGFIAFRNFIDRKIKELSTECQLERG